MPAALKLVSGNPGKRALDLDAGINPPVEIPACPGHLNEHGKKEWRRITVELEEVGLISRLDRAALSIYCQTWGRLVLAEQALEMCHPAWGVAMCVGVVPEGQTVSTLPTRLLSGRTWTGSMMGGAKRQDVARFVEMYLAGEFSLDEVVSHRLTLAEINHGVEMMRSGESVRSVVMF